MTSARKHRGKRTDRTKVENAEIGREGGMQIRIFTVVTKGGKESGPALALLTVDHVRGISGNIGEWKRVELK